PLMKFFSTRALRASDYVSFRDEKSQALAHQIGFTGTSQVYPDSAYGLEFSPPTRVPSRGCEQSVVGAAPRPYCPPRGYPGEKDQAVYDEVIRQLALFTSWLAEHSYSIGLFGTDIGVDPLAIEDLQAALRKRPHGASGHFAVHDAVKSLHELLATMSGMD